MKNYKLIFLKIKSNWFKNFYRTFEGFTICYNKLEFKKGTEINIEVILFNFEFSLRLRDKGVIKEYDKF